MSLAHVSKTHENGFLLDDPEVVAWRSNFRLSGLGGQEAGYWWWTGSDAPVTGSNGLQPTSDGF